MVGIEKITITGIKADKNIELINEGGWHFNYLLKPNEISKKFKSLAETSWDKEEYFNEKNIIKKIELKMDLFNRGHIFDIVKIDESFPGNFHLFLLYQKCVLY